MPRLSSHTPQLLLLALVAMLLFGNCARNVYRLLGPGTTPAQVGQLKQLDTAASAAYRAASERPDSVAGPTPSQVFDSADAARRRLLTPEQYRRYNTRSVLPLRYPRRPPAGFQ